MTDEERALKREKRKQQEAANEAARIRDRERAQKKIDDFEAEWPDGCPHLIAEMGGIYPRGEVVQGWHPRCRNGQTSWELHLMNLEPQGFDQWAEVVEQPGRFRWSVYCWFDTLRVINRGWANELQKAKAKAEDVFEAYLRDWGLDTDDWCDKMRVNHAMKWFDTPPIPVSDD
jgi:hypothetical protein